MLCGPDDKHAVHVFDTVEAPPRDSISEGHFQAQLCSDVHKMRRDAPVGTPLFQTELEYHNEKQEPSQSEEWSPAVNPEEEEEVKEPGPARTYCEACGDTFKSYTKHISSTSHLYKLSQLNTAHYPEIDLLIEGLAKDKGSLLDFYKGQSLAAQSFLDKLKQKPFLSPVSLAP